MAAKVRRHSYIISVCRACDGSPAWSLAREITRSDAVCRCTRVRHWTPWTLVSVSNSFLMRADRRSAPLTARFAMRHAPAGNATQRQVRFCQLLFVHCRLWRQLAVTDMSQTGIHRLESVPSQDCQPYQPDNMHRCSMPGGRRGGDVTSSCARASCHASGAQRWTHPRLSSQQSPRPKMCRQRTMVACRRCQLMAPTYKTAARRSRSSRRQRGRRLLRWRCTSSRGRTR